MDKHVTGEFLEWLEGTTTHREWLEKHLRECVSCRKYYETMRSVLSPMRGEKSEARLPADPYLPTRIVAYAVAQHHPVWMAYLLRWSFATLSFLIAGAGGIYLGKELYQAGNRQPASAEVGGGDVASSYSRALLQKNFSTNLDSLMQVVKGRVQ